jgi:hypothetical protein
MGQEPFVRETAPEGETKAEPQQALVRAIHPANMINRKLVALMSVTGIGASRSSCQRLMAHYGPLWWLARL